MTMGLPLSRNNSAQGRGLQQGARIDQRSMESLWVYGAEGVLSGGLLSAVLVGISFASTYARWGVC